MTLQCTDKRVSIEGSGSWPLTCQISTLFLGEWRATTRLFYHIRGNHPINAPAPTANHGQPLSTHQHQLPITANCLHPTSTHCQSWPTNINHCQPTTTHYQSRPPTVNQRHLLYVGNWHSSLNGGESRTHAPMTKCQSCSNEWKEKGGKTH